MASDPLTTGHPLLRAVRRAGRTYPVGLVRAPARSLEETVVDDGLPVAIDPELQAAGRTHVEDVRRRVPGLFNGPVLAFRSLEDGRIRAGRSDYLTMLATSGALEGDVTARRRAIAAAGGDPVLSGAGRAAAVGLSVVVRLRIGGQDLLPLGRRRTDLAIEPGRWGLVAGAVEPGPGSRPLRVSLVRELSEEVPGPLERAGLRPTIAAARARCLGVAVNLGRLSPTVCVEVLIDLCDAAAPARLMDASEFTDTVLVPATRGGMSTMWDERGAELTSNAAGALAAWERSRGSAMK